MSEPTYCGRCGRRLSSVSFQLSKRLIVCDECGFDAMHKIAEHPNMEQAAKEKEDGR